MVFTSIAASATAPTAPTTSTSIATVALMATVTALAVAALEATFAAVASILRTTVLEVASATAPTATAPTTPSPLLAVATTVAVAGGGCLGLAAEESLDPAEQTAGLRRRLGLWSGLLGTLRLGSVASRIATLVPAKLAAPAFATLATLAETFATRAVSTGITAARFVVACAIPALLLCFSRLRGQYVQFRGDILLPGLHGFDACLDRC